MTKPKTCDFKKIGRPSLYNEEIAAEVCGLVASGLSIRRVCMTPGMPGRRTIYEWEEKVPDFAHNLARAREDCADWHADQAVQAALDAKDKDSAAAARVKIQVHLALAKVIDPKRYNDRLEVEHKGNLSLLTGGIVVNVLRSRQQADQIIDVTPELPALPED